MKKKVTVLYLCLIAAGLGTSYLRLAHPIRVSATTCENISCWTPGGGADWRCKDRNKNCTAGCNITYCFNVQ